MFRKMRRSHQQMPDDEVKKVLENASYGTLAVIGDNGYPYAVPVNFVYYNDKIYFHCAKSGHKIDSINENSKVSFCIVGEEEVIPEKYTTYYKSVIVFGNAKTVIDDKLKREAVTALAKKYVPFSDDEIKKEVDSFFNPLCVVEISIDSVTGKEYKPQQ